MARAWSISWTALAVSCLMASTSMMRPSGVMLAREGRRLRGLLDALRERFPAQDWRHLSMGMTDDFEVAVEEGSTLVRIGRAIFGARMA